MATMPTTRLTTGVLEEILKGRIIDYVVLQLLNMKKVQCGGAQPRFRLSISDGEGFTNSAMLGTQLNDIAETELTPFAVFRVDRYVVNTATKELRKIVIILDAKLLAHGENVGRVLGNPSLLSSMAEAGGGEASQANPKGHAPTGGSIGDQATTSINASNRAALEQVNCNALPSSSSSVFYPSAKKTATELPSRVLPTGKPPVQPQGECRTPATSSLVSPSKTQGAGVGVHPISSLTPYQNKWTICARVTSKPSIRTWSNARGQGKLFSVNLLDESGEIRATAFNEQCEKFFDLIQIDKVYYISQAQLKTANKQFSSLQNDYEMTFTFNTQVTPCEEKTNIPSMQFNFVNIEQLENEEKDTLVDVIGICKTADDVATITAKATGKECQKRDVQIVDESEREIRLTLWGADAETFDGSNNPVLAVKGVKVSDFNGKSLSALSSTTILINPDIQEAHRLRAWFARHGSTLQTFNLSNRIAGDGAGGNFKTIKEAALLNLGADDTPGYYATKGTICMVRRENCVYPACPSEGCNKKVIDLNNGLYRCEKCNKEYDSYNYRLLLSMSIGDFTDDVWTTVFCDQAEALLKYSSEDVGRMRDTDADAFDNIFSKLTFEEYIFKLRIKSETYNDETRLKTTMVSAEPLDCREYNRKLIQEIKNMTALSNS